MVRPSVIQLNVYHWTFCIGPDYNIENNDDRIEYELKVYQLSTLRKN